MMQLYSSVVFVYDYFVIILGWWDAQKVLQAVDKVTGSIVETFSLYCRVVGCTEGPASCRQGDRLHG